MARRIIIIGGLPDNPDRVALLERLRVQTVKETKEEVKWEWIKAELPGWNVPEKPFRKLLGTFWNHRPAVDLPVVVMLFCLNRRDQNKLFSSGVDPKLAPKKLQRAEDLIKWLLSPESQLIPRIEWYGCLSEAALAALLSKLIKNKSWNKDTQGHAWTKEADLLGQSPVKRKGFDKVKIEAHELLRIADGVLFLSKGGTQGKTPKEWCIILEHVKLVKRMILARSFAEMKKVASMKSLHRRLEHSDNSLYRIDGDIITEKVKNICGK